MTARTTMPEGTIRRRARVVSTVIAVLCVVATLVGLTMTLSTAERVPVGQIVVVGDLDTPGMRAVVAELTERVESGDDLVVTEADPVAGLALLIPLAWLAIGMLIVWRQPTNWAGWLFILTGAALPLLNLSSSLVTYGLKVEPGAIPFVGMWAVIGEYALYPMTLIPLLFLLYPDGHPPSRRWRWAVYGIAGGALLALLAFMVRPGPLNNWRDDGIVYANPVGIDAFRSISGTLIAVGAIAILAASLATVVAVRQRFRRSTGEERQQMRWLVFVASLAGAFFTLLLVLSILGGVFGLEESGDDLPIFDVLFAITLFTIVLGVPAAYLIAIFRYRLWDLDVVIKKAAVALVLTGLLVGIGLLLIGILGRTAVSEGNALGVVVGLIAGALLLPLFRLSRRIAGRIVFGRRASPYEVLTAFGERVGGTYATEDVLPRMAQILADGTGATIARVWLLVSGELRPEAAWPADAPAVDPVRASRDQIPEIEGESAFEVSDAGEVLGVLSVAMPASDPMNPAKEKLVRDLASHAGLVLRNVRLIEDLRASRQRLVAAQDQERRRLERNIHDGAQQQLVALTVKLRLAQGLIAKDAAKAEAMLTDLQAETQTALEDLRDLARGIYPPLLADKGLTAALQAQSRKSLIAVEVQGDDLGRYGQDVEAAVYFCTLEALNNVAKYAQASRATITLEQRNGHLRFTVSDDGRGFDPTITGYGTGLQGMADRLDAIGGAIEVRSAPGAGTTVTGRVPVGSST
ncbi:MAG TPA: sensor histidine kinase [Actinomycetota bacterium]|nr:sensor histidine kinase [Actinomycetota bacterium]